MQTKGALKYNTSEAAQNIDWRPRVKDPEWFSAAQGSSTERHQKYRPQARGESNGDTKVP